MDAATIEHVISQVGRVLDAEVAYRNQECQMGQAQIPPIIYHHKPPLDETPSEKPKMSITGLESGAFKSKLAELRKRVADKQTEGLAKIDGSVTAGVAKLEAATDTVVSKVDKEIAAQIEEFAAFGDNGGEA